MELEKADAIRAMIDGKVVKAVGSAEIYRYYLDGCFKCVDNGRTRLFNPNDMSKMVSYVITEYTGMPKKVRQMI